jgi:hypothetical protein
MMTEDSAGDRTRRWILKRRIASAALMALVGVAVLAIVAFIFVMEMDVPVSEVPRQGTLTGWSQTLTYGPGATRMSVQLEDGRVVEAGAGGHPPLRVGSRVLVYEQTTRVLGRTTYRFGRTLEEAPSMFN